MMDYTWCRFVVAKKVDNNNIIAGFIIYLDALDFLKTLGNGRVGESYSIYKVNQNTERVYPVQDDAGASKQVSG